MISLLAITGLLIAGIICSCIVVVTAKPEESRIFMATRIEHCGNTDIVISLLGYVRDYKVPDVLTWRSVPWSALVPAFVLSELKTAFPVLAVGLIGLALVSTRRKKEFTMKHTKYTMISIALGMAIVLLPSALRADEETTNTLTEALKKDLHDINNYSPFAHFFRTEPPYKNTWAYIEEKGKTRFDDWKKAAEAGIPEGQVLLGHYYYSQTGIGKLAGEVDADLAKEFWEKSVKLYRQAAEQGNADGQFHYAGWSQSDNNDNLTDTDWYRKAAEQGHARAQYEFAEKLRYGPEGREGMTLEIMGWYRKAAEQGLADAQWMVGMSYRGWGKDFPYDPAKAAEWYHKAAEQGLRPTMSGLGLFYMEGEGVPQDYDKAAEWFQKAADLCDSWGEHYLGVCYLEGKGVAKDVEKAVELFRKSARNEGQNFPGAYYRLGWCYATGTGVEQDIEEALRWLREYQEKYRPDILYADEVAVLLKKIEDEQNRSWMHRAWNWLTGMNSEIRIR